MAKFEITKLIHEPDTDRIFIEVQYKGYPIQKWYDPNEPNHPAEIAIFKSNNENAINAIVQALGRELITALQHPDVGILDENEEVIPRPTSASPKQVDLLKNKKK